MASHRSPHPRYQRHQPEQTALYAIVEQRLRKLCAGLAQQDASLPAFVTREFRDYLRCGLLEYGFIRVKCNGCRHEHLVAFSCKRRGFCRGAQPVLWRQTHDRDLGPSHRSRYPACIGAPVGAELSLAAAQ